MCLTPTPVQCGRWEPRLGSDEGAPVSDAYQTPFKFTGKIDKVTIDLKETTPAVAEETKKSRSEAALKKGLSD
jgi:arylsulfatase